MLTDFGIAKMLQDDKSGNLTTSGIGMGTPEYMSPEQVMGSPVDVRTDIYSLGIVFYEMVTGRTPFKADTPMAIAIKLVNDPLPRPRQYVPGLPPQAEQVIFKALAKQADDRYLDMGAFAAALEGLSASVPAAKRGSTIMPTTAPVQMAEAIPAKKPTFGQRIKKIYKENSTCVILVIVALVVLSCLCVILGSIQQRKDKESFAATQTAQAVLPAAATRAPTTAGKTATGVTTPLPERSKIKTCSLVPGEPLLNARFPDDAQKFTTDFSQPYFYFTQKAGMFEVTQNGVRLTSGPESAAVVALNANQPGSVLAIQSMNSGDFSVLLIDENTLKNPEDTNKDGIRLVFQVENKGDNNASISYIENGVPGLLASFQYPLRRETLVTFDLTSHKLTVLDTQGEVIFGAKLPESITSEKSYWVIGDPATDNQGYTNLLLRGICFQDAAAK